jgi:hypothetical protein
MFETMPRQFNKEAAKGLSAVYQFNLAGDGGSNWQILISNCQCQIKEGTHPSPNTTISMTLRTMSIW